MHSSVQRKDSGNKKGKSYKDLPFGRSGEIRTHGLMVPNGHQKIFLTIFAYFQPFSIVFFFSLQLSRLAFSSYSASVYGMFCGQAVK